MKLTITAVSRKEINTKKGPATKLSLLTNEYGKTWLGGFEDERTVDWKEGQTVEVESVETTADGKWTNWRLPRIAKLNNPAPPPSGTPSPPPPQPPGAPPVPPQRPPTTLPKLPAPPKGGNALEVLCDIRDLLVHIEELIVRAADGGAKTSPSKPSPEVDEDSYGKGGQESDLPF